MGTTGAIQYRIANSDDAFALMRLYQIALPSIFQDPLLLDYRRLKTSLESDNNIWVVADRESELIVAISILRDVAHRLGKIQRIYVNTSIENYRDITKETLLFLISHLTDNVRKLDVLYTTTRTVPFKQLQLTEDVGFKNLGFFPIVIGEDSSSLQGITAYFFKDVLIEKRYTNFSLHPLVVPFYKITAVECNLEAMAVADVLSSVPSQTDTLPPLEVIHAPRFVNRRFNLLKERKFLSLNFYPFQEPNALIVDPDQKIEIFIKLFPEINFAAIIEDHLELLVNPSELYQEISRILRKQNITYIEVINDAADVEGIDSILKAQYLPCVYFPCLKSHGEMRRDYIIFGRSFEKINFSLQGVSKIYLDYLNEYRNIEAKINAL